MKGYYFHSKADYEILKHIKEKYCFISCDIESDRKLYHETTFYNFFTKLPDGRKIFISNEMFEAPEILFRPYLLQNEQNEIVYMN